MKNFCPILLTIALFLCPIVPANGGEHPSMLECTSIHVRSSEGWWLSINQDGSGSYGFGTGLARVETAKSTFDFGQVYTDFENEFTKKPGKAGEAYMAVSYWVEGSRSAIEHRFSQNHDYLARLFKRARIHSRQPTNELEIRSHNRVEEFWESSPWNQSATLSPGNS